MMRGGALLLLLMAPGARGTSQPTSEPSLSSKPSASPSFTKQTTEDLKNGFADLHGKIAKIKDADIMSETIPVFGKTMANAIGCGIEDIFNLESIVPAWGDDDIEQELEIYFQGLTSSSSCNDISMISKGTECSGNNMVEKTVTADGFDIDICVKATLSMSSASLDAAALFQGSEAFNLDVIPSGSVSIERSIMLNAKIKIDSDPGTKDTEFLHVIPRLEMDDSSLISTIVAVGMLDLEGDFTWAGEATIDFDENKNSDACDRNSDYFNVKKGDSDLESFCAKRTANYVISGDGIDVSPYAPFP